MPLDKDIGRARPHMRFCSLPWRAFRDRGGKLALAARARPRSKARLRFAARRKCSKLGMERLVYWTLLFSPARPYWHERSLRNASYSSVDAKERLSTSQSRRQKFVIKAFWNFEQDERGREEETAPLPCNCFRTEIAVCLLRRNLPRVRLYQGDAANCAPLSPRLD